MVDNLIRKVVLQGNGQSKIAIPRIVRDVLKLENKDSIQFIIEGNEVKIIKVEG